MTDNDAANDPFDEDGPAFKLLCSLKPISHWWTVAGDSALVYHLRHRELAQLDLARDNGVWDAKGLEATLRAIVPDRLPDAAAKRAQIGAALDRDEGGVRLRLGGLVVSFELAPAVRGFKLRADGEEHVPVASMADAVGAKMQAIVGRAVAQDYADMAAIIEDDWFAEDLIETAGLMASFTRAQLNLLDFFKRLHTPPAEVAQALTNKQRGLLHKAGQSGLETVTA